LWPESDSGLGWVVTTTITSGDFGWNPILGWAGLGRDDDDQHQIKTGLKDCAATLPGNFKWQLPLATLYYDNFAWQLYLT
jgi:hypothetical protein